MPELIRNLGNCGSLEKLDRITKALDVAIKHKVTVVIVVDPLVYGSNKSVLTCVEDYDFSRTEISIKHTFIGTDGTPHTVEETFPWWDITKVNLIF